MSEITQKQAQQIWFQASERVKDRVIAPTLYRALEAAVGIAIEGDEFIIGFANQDIPLAGHLRSAQHRAIIDQCVSEIYKHKVRVKIIEGSTYEDYARYKEQQQTRVITQTTISAQREKERQIIVAWNDVAEKITRQYAKLHMRNFPQMRAEFLWSAFKILNEAVDRMNYNDDSDEIQKRALARVFEKFATVVEVPSTMLAFEFFKLRKEGKLS